MNIQHKNLSGAPKPDELYNFHEPPTDELRLKVQSLDNDDIETLNYLDSIGLLASSDENIEAYKKRILLQISDYEELQLTLNQSKLFEISPNLNLRESHLVEPSLITEALEKVKSLYAVSPVLAKAFYADSNIGLFVGGCAISFDSDLSVIILRRNFQKKRKWLLYESSELLSHELCHCARYPVKDNSLEEFFAYATSSSPLRRYLGNCFQSSWDAILLLLPIFILLIIAVTSVIFRFDINIIYFWILALLYPAFLLFRNHKVIAKLRKAESVLESFVSDKKNIKPILFRSRFSDISLIAGLTSKEEFSVFVKDKVDSSLRWRVIQSRFINPQNESNQI